MDEEKEENSVWEVIANNVKNLLSALLLIGGGCLLYYYSETISDWFGNAVQDAFNSIFDTIAK